MRPAHLGVEQLDAGPAPLLGAGTWRRRSRGACPRPGAGLGVGDADAGGDDGLPPAEHDRLGHGRRPPVRRRRGPRRSARSSQTDDELVAGQAADGVGGPHRRPQPFGDRTAARRRPAEWPNESLTTLKRSRSTNRTVDPPAGPLRTGQRLVEPVEDEAAVGQPGQRVVGGLVDGVVEGPAHPVDGGGVVEGQRGVLGEGEEHLLLGGGVAAGLERPDEEAADDLRRCGRRERPWPSAGRGRRAPGGRRGRRRSPRR